MEQRLLGLVLRLFLRPRHSAHEETGDRATNACALRRPPTGVSGVRRHRAGRAAGLATLERGRDQRRGWHCRPALPCKERRHSAVLRQLLRPRAQRLALPPGSAVHEVHHCVQSHHKRQEARARAHRRPAESLQDAGTYEHSSGRAGALAGAAAAPATLGRPGRARLLGKRLVQRAGVPGRPQALQPVHRLQLRAAAGVISSRVLKV